MKPWYRLDLGDAVAAQAELAHIREAWQRFCESRELEGSGSVYVRHTTVAALHCHVTVYVSPDAAPFAAQLGAESCPAPSPQGLVDLGDLP